MSFKVPVKSFQVAKADTQLGVVVGVVDLGMQANPFAGREGGENQPAFKHMVNITFELPDDLVTEGEHAGKPLHISKEFALSFAGSGTKKSGLRLLVENAFKKEFTTEELRELDLTTLIGKGVLLQIEHQTSKNKKTYAKIANTMKVDSRTVVPALVAAPIVITPDSSDEDIAKLSNQFLKDKIVKGRLGNQVTTNTF